MRAGMVPPVDPAKYYAFVVAMFFMAISPGPANLFFIRTGLSGSKLRVLAGVLGTNSASVVWFIASALGLQVLMQAFPVVFQIIAFLGGLYVGWLGFKTFRTALNVKNETLDAGFTAPLEQKSNWVTLREGFMVQLLNPKMVLFLTAVLTPFVDIHRPMVPQMIVFAATTISMDVITMTSYGLGAVSLSRILSEPKNKQKFDLGAGGILMIIACLIVAHAVLDYVHSH